MYTTLPCRFFVYRQPEIAKFCEVNVFPYLRDLRLSLGIPAATPSPLVTIPQATSASLPPPHAPSSSSSSPSVTTSSLLSPSIPLSESKTSAGGPVNSEDFPRSSVLQTSSTPSSTSDMAVKHNKLLKPAFSTSSASSSVNEGSSNSNQTTENKEGEKERYLKSKKSVGSTQEDEEKKTGSRKNEREEELHRARQERLALQHEKLQMEILLGLFARLSDAQKRMLGFLEAEQLEEKTLKKEGDKHEGDDLQSSDEGKQAAKKQSEEQRREKEEKKAHPNQETGGMYSV